MRPRLPETHHIQCKFDGGLVIPQNEISLYETNHILAHIIRFICQKKPGDFMASLLRLCSDSSITLSERGKLAAALNKDNKILFWSSEWQQKQAYKGGQKGGLANTFAQFEARSKIGKMYGKFCWFNSTNYRNIRNLKKNFYF